MKNNTLVFILSFFLMVVSCGPTKNMDDDKLYNATWELEYISGPRIAFEGLFPDKKPQISFNRETGKAEGNNSCNGYSADYTLSGSSISFGEPGPTTMMFCGQGEKQFLNMMQKVNAYSFDDQGKLNLLVGSVPMMRFKKLD